MDLHVETSESHAHALALADDYGWQDFAALAPPTTTTAIIASSASLPPPASSLAPATATAKADANESTILLSTGTAIDPSHQRCYCGAAECSGFLGGGRSKAKSKGKGKGKGKGKKRAEEEEQEPGRERGELGFVQAKIRVVDHERRVSGGGGETPMRSGREAARRANEKLAGGGGDGR